jgi:PAP2 superfamily
VTSAASSVPHKEAPSATLAALDFHWIASLLLVIVVVPAFVLLKIPLSVNWERLVTIYWVGLSLRSVAFAAVLMVVGFPPDQTLRPVWKHYKQQKARFAFLVVFAIAMFLQFGPISGLILMVLAIVLGEIVDRTHGDLNAIVGLLKRLLLPSLYLFFGLVMVFAYNDVVASIRKPSVFDWLYLRMDSYLLAGSSVSAIAHSLIHRTPGTAMVAETIYYGMFNQIGAALIIVGVCVGSKQALRYVGTLLTAYYLGLILFFLWPSMGPFFSCPNHFSEFPQFLRTYGAQMGMVAKAHLLATNRSLSQVDTDYFVAFPCLHIAQPLIVIWFLRRWKGIVIFLIAYDFLLIPSILLLEWHYVVDLIGGVAVAWLAIWLNERRANNATELASSWGRALRERVDRDEAVVPPRTVGA